MLSIVTFSPNCQVRTLISLPVLSFISSTQERLKILLLFRAKADVEIFLGRKYLLLCLSTKIVPSKWEFRILLHVLFLGKWRLKIWRHSLHSRKILFVCFRILFSIALLSHNYLPIWKLTGSSISCFWRAILTLLLPVQSKFFTTMMIMRTDIFVRKDGAHDLNCEALSRRWNLSNRGRAQFIMVTIRIEAILACPLAQSKEWLDWEAHWKRIKRILLKTFTFHSRVLLLSISIFSGCNWWFETI